MTVEHTEFEWDRTKAARNLDKHGVPFIEAARAMRDGTIRTQRDPRGYGREVRWNSLAQHPESGVLLMVTWTRREEATRIISARPANRKERPHE